MKPSISTKYALRSLSRHPRRSILSVVGIGMGCAVCLFVIGFVRGEGEMMMRAAAESGAGHIRIVPSKWTETRENDLRLPGWQDLLERVRGMKEVALAVPHARTDALLAFGTRTAGVQIVGVDAEREQQANRLVRDVTEGTYLQAGAEGTTVVGAAIADRLNVEVGDQLMVTASGKDGEMRGAMLEIAGVIATGSRQLDSTICHVNLQDVEALTGYEGAAELTLFLADPSKLAQLVDTLQRSLDGDTTVMTYAELYPELASGVEIDKTWSRLVVGIITLVVFLGIASAQLAAVLERRREFAVLAAIGMKSWRLVMAVVLEGLALGIFGGMAGLAIGVPATYYVATQGINFGALVGDADMSVSNILMDPIVYGDFGWFLVPLAMGIALTATILSSLYPAWFAVRTDPATALRVDR